MSTTAPRWLWVRPEARRALGNGDIGTILVLQAPDPSLLQGVG
ncbi:hypothetical protein HDA32_005179 [Spinactinospora alkalitolerans]|uniref:Uncharacterized protein n=1 Tax=Spinactinospora alkalitolerans TaxID=687207 RepID=A0A852U1H8_9ACTN|nr:hypothetical protein [Spinactinospora alkalitolerans]